MVTNGLTGRVPYWYEVVMVAKWLGVTPEAVLDMPLTWVERVKAAMRLEHEMAKEEVRRWR